MPGARRIKKNPKQRETESGAPMKMTVRSARSDYRRSSSNEEKEGVERYAERDHSQAKKKKPL